MLPDLLRAGVASLKIEGRLKTPEDVANITRIYRKALDRLEENSRFTFHASPSDVKREDEKHELQNSGHDQYAMEMAFSRGLYTGWFGGVNTRNSFTAGLEKNAAFISAMSQKFCATRSW